MTALTKQIDFKMIIISFKIDLVEIKLKSNFEINFKSNN